MTPRFDVVVVGGGQAGLAIGYFLAQQQRRFTILEAADTPAAAWRQRWDSLKLFTPVRYNSLPGLPFPGDADSYPGRDEVVDYLAEYARRFELPVELNSRVRAVVPHDQARLPRRGRERPRLRDRTGRDRHRAVPGAADAAGRRRPRPGDRAAPQQRLPVAEPDPRGPVLVVGGGNTGYQIAEELVARARGAPLDRVTADAAAAAHPRARPVHLSGSGTVDARDGHVATGTAPPVPRDADRLQSARRPAPARHPPARPHPAGRGPAGGVRRRDAAWSPTR